MHISNTLDPITVEVVRSYYRSTANQMSSALMRASFSPIIYEVMDFSLGVYNAEAELIAEGKGLPVFMGTLSYAIRAVMDYVGRENVEEGDVLLCTYPYWTGSHSQDAVTIKPIFVDGKIFGYAAAKAHWMDIGAKDIYGTDTTDIWQEGLQIRGAKVVKKGVLDREITEILCANSRLPDALMGDLTAQIAACDIGTRRVLDLVAKHGPEIVSQAIARILDHGEEIARQAIKNMPDGEWRAEVALDNDGISDDVVPIKMTVKIKGDQIMVDMTGTAPQTVGPVNCPMPSSMSALRLAMKMVVAPHYDANEGFFRPLSAEIPERTVANPSVPAPVFIYGWTTMAIGEAFFAALAQGVPKHSIARSGGDIGAILWSGTDPETGAYFAGGGDEACGAGASADADGENALIHFALGECRNIPVEILEERYPVLTELYQLRVDSAGAGRNRGGLGVQRQWRLLNDISLISVIEQTKKPPEGVDGGKGGMTNTLLLNPGTDRERKEAKLSAYKLKRGETLRVETAGGAGWGSSFERDAEKVLSDVIAGYVTMEAAKRDYGVVVRQEERSFGLDKEATADLRKSASMSVA